MKKIRPSTISHPPLPGPARQNKGSALTEFAPAMFILIMVFFFPLLNMIMLALSYADVLYLDNLVLRQAALENVLIKDASAPNGFTTDLRCSTDANGSLNTVIYNWQNSGVGKFVATGSTPKQTAYIDLTEGSATAKYIHVDLTADVKPFLTLPFPMLVPGINAPVTFKFSGRSLIENIPN